MSCCPFFKNGYFAVCTASKSDYVPSIAEMEQFCFGENCLCPTFDLYSTRSFSSARNDMKPASIPLAARSPER